MKTFFTLILIMGVPAACLATADLGIFLQSQSPDGRLVEINGGIWSDDANILGWVYDWGDGTSSTGWFPMLHRYGWPGDFTVTVTGFDDTGATAVSDIQVVVPDPAPTDVVFVLGEPGSEGMKCGDSLEVILLAYDADWNRLSVAGRSLEVYYPGSGDFVDVVVQDTTLHVTAKPLSDRDFAWASIYAFVDGVPSLDPINLVTNTNAGDFRYNHAWYVGSYLPDTFFTASDLATEEYTHINDLAFDADMVGLGGKNPNQGDRALFQGISYSPPVYGASGNPLGLGDYSVPQNGRPYFDVIFHEMGHNFTGTNHLFNCIGMPGPFYQETIAEWFVQYDLDHILGSHAGELSPAAIGMLEDIRAENRSYHLSEYQNYVSGGCQFDYYNISSSHALVEKIYEYCDTYGWTSLKPAMDFFDHARLWEYAAVLAAHGGIASETNRVTFLMAALTYAFEHDVRPDLAPLNFPVDDTLFDDLMNLWGAGVDATGRDRPANPRDGSRAISLEQNRPNPFVGTTKISYWLPREMEVELTVYDIQGRTVAVVDEGMRQAGPHQAAFDASALSPGVYLCKLRAGQASAERKIVVAR